MGSIIATTCYKSYLVSLSESHCVSPPTYTTHSPKCSPLPSAHLCTRHPPSPPRARRQSLQVQPLQGRDVAHVVEGQVELSEGLAAKAAVSGRTDWTEASFRAGWAKGFRDGWRDMERLNVSLPLRSVNHNDFHSTYTGHNRVASRVFLGINLRIKLKVN